MTENKNVLVAISGGRSSALMSYHIHNSPKFKDWNKIFVFANTGMERPETIQFLKNIEKYWGIEIIKIEGVYSNEMNVGVNFKIVDWENLDMNAKPFEGAVMHMNKGSFDGLPNSAAPYCSERMKTIPSKKLGDSIFGLNNYKTAIGFRFEDMPKRISFAEIKVDQKRIFPLLTDFETPVTQQFLNDWWSKQPFKLEIHNKFGNCELCWKKSEKNLIEVIRHGTRFVDWVDTMEQKYQNTMFRNQLSIHDLVKMASLPTTAEFNFDDNDDNCVCSFT